MIEVSNYIEVCGRLSVRETASVLESFRVDIKRRPMDLFPVYLRRAFRQRASGSQGFALLIQLVERLHALGDHELDHDQNADAAAHNARLLWGLVVAQVPRADVAKEPLALKLLLDVFAQLR